MNNNPQQEFDIKQFNINFDAMKSKISAQNEIIDAETLAKLNNQSNLPKIPIYLQTPEDIIFNVKTTWFNIYDEIVANGFQLQIFDKNDRLFYIGITCLFFAFVLYTIHILFDFDTGEKQETKTIIEKHFYHEKT